MAQKKAEQLDELYKLVEKIETAMLTTRRPDGRLVSRPMATQERNSIADLWYVTDVESLKLDELEHDPNVNLAFLHAGSREWVSVSGTARVSTNRELIHSLYKPDWKIWFGKMDDVRDGGPDDPRIALILVDAEVVLYMKRDRPRPMVLFELAKSMITGDRAELGDVQRVDMG